jgi:outer membrane protein assembly factor BamC
MLINIKKVKYCVIPLMMVACSTSNFDSQGDYGAASPRNSSNLAVPPGLVAPDTNSNYKMLDAKQEGYVLSSVKDMQIVQAGSERWLLIKGKSVDKVWPMMQAFINQQGLSIKFQNQNVGLIQTNWSIRDTTVPETGARKFFDWVGLGGSYSLGSQYMYRITLWQNESDTQVFVSDYQMNEVYPGCVTNLNENIRVQPSDAQATKWIPVQPDPALELGFLMQFMAFSGYTPEEAKQVVAANVSAAKESATDAAYLVGTTLVINDNFDRSWWRTGIALERAGLGVLTKDRTLGQYDVYPLQSEVNNPDPGFLSNLFGDNKNQIKMPNANYTVKLEASGNKTNLTINLYQGANDSDFTKHQNSYLKALQKQLK